MLDEIPGQEPTEITAPDRSDRYAIDFGVIRGSSRSQLSDVFEWDDFPGLMIEMLKGFVMLPRADVQIPFVASYLSLPTGMCTKIPVLFSHGMSGCGKSVIASIASAIYSSPKLGAASTMAALRNQITAGKFSQGRESHYALIWDDVNPGMLSNNNGMIFSLIKNGVERGATITIASGEAGENVEFDIFSSKVTSSIHPIYSLSEFRELIRRVIVIQHKPVQHWLMDDYSEFYGDITADDLVDTDDINMQQARVEFFQFWNVAKLTEFALIKGELKSIRKVHCPRPLWNMSKDILTCGVVCGYWPSLKDGIAAICDYWAWHKDNIENQSTNLTKVLKRFITEKSESIDKRNKIARDCGQLGLIQELEIEPMELKIYFELALKNGEVEPGSRAGQMNDAMLDLGFRLSQNSQGKSAWMLITS